LLILSAHSCPTSVSIHNLNVMVERDSLFGLKSNVQQINTNIEIFQFRLNIHHWTCDIDDKQFIAWLLQPIWNQYRFNVSWSVWLILQSFCFSSFSLLFHFDFSSLVSPFSPISYDSNQHDTIPKHRLDATCHPFSCSEPLNLLLLYFFPHYSHVCWFCVRLDATCYRWTFESDLSNNRENTRVMMIKYWFQSRKG